MLTPKTLTRILSVILALLVVAAVILGVLLLQARTGVSEHRAAPTNSEAKAAAGDEATAAAEGESVEVSPTAPAAPEATEVAAPAPAAPAVTTTVTEQTTAQRLPPSSGSGSGSGMPVGLSSSGWNDNSATSCGSGESLVYAGRGGGNWVTVCSSGSTLNYRGDVFDGVLSAQVDRSASLPADAYFTIPASPHTIVISGSELNVYDGGRAVSGATFSDTYVAR